MEDEIEDPAWDDLLSWLQSKNPGIKGSDFLVCSKRIPGWRLLLPVAAR